MDQSWEKVLQFHRHFSVPYKERPTLLSEDRVQIRSEWMQEEIQEFLASQSLDEQADAMIDLIYLALGTLVEMGVRPEELFHIVHEANMSKLWADGKPHYRETDGKVIKPPSWQDPAPLLRAAIAKQQGKCDKI